MSKRISEATHQKDFVFYVRRAEKVVPRITGNAQMIRMTAPCNGLPVRHPGHKVEAKKMGMMPGVPDLIISHPRKGYHGLFIEMKAENGSVSALQAAYIDDLNSEGFRAVVCFGFAEAMEVFNDFFGITETEFRQLLDEPHIQQVLDRHGICSSTLLGDLPEQSA